MLTVDSINWRYLLSHPSEFVRIDEQLRLLETEISEFRNVDGHMLLKWSFAAQQENESHFRLIKNFRCAINLFGSKIFNAKITSDEEQHKLETFLLKIAGSCEPPKPNIFEENIDIPKEMFEKLVECIAKRKNTEKIFQQFLVFIFDNYVNAFNANPLLFQSDLEKENIMHEIITRIR